MAKIVVEEQAEFITLPEDTILHLKIEEATVKEVNGRNGDWEKLEIKFKVLGVQAMGDGTASGPAEEAMLGQNIWGSVPFKLTEHPENKLRLWAESILGMELGVGYELDTDLFLRREVRGITSTYDKRMVDPKTGLKFKGHQVSALLPKGDYAAPAAAPAAPVSAATAAANPWAGSPAAATPAPAATSWDSEPPF